MRRAHSRYDALVGALLLGEATPADRAELMLHADSCPECSRDVEAGVDAVAALGRARREETWRPSVLDPTLRRIDRHQRWRSRWTVNALVIAFALAFVLHVGVVTGLGAQTVVFLRAAAMVVAQRAAPASRAP